MLRGPLFGSLTGDQVSRLVCVFRLNRYHRNHILFFEGGSAQHIFALRSGLVKVVKLFENGKDRIVRVILPGELFGLEALTETTYPLTAVTLRECEICATSRDELFDFLRKDQEIALGMISFLVGEVTRIRAQITDMCFKDAHKKLATFLISLVSSETDSSLKTESLTLPFSRQEISEILELSPETISRTLGAFRRERLIETRGRHLIIRNLAGLQSAAQRQAGPRCSAFEPSNPAKSPASKDKFPPLIEDCKS